MTRRNLPAILLLNLLGIALFFSWYILANHGFWFKMDSAIYFYFNQHLLPSPSFLHLVAVTNNWAFDVISLIGAHWFTDIAVGSLSVVLVGISWILLTPLSDKVIDAINRNLLGSKSQ